jgi:hypothetical protein
MTRPADRGRDWGWEQGLAFGVWRFGFRVAVGKDGIREVAKRGEGGLERGGGGGGDIRKRVGVGSGREMLHVLKKKVMKSLTLGRTNAGKQ